MPRFRYGQVEADDQVGVVTGLAWTEVGGELLTIEGVMMPGKGRMTVTGNLNDVMKESISAAASYVRSRAIDFGIEPPLFDKRDIHVHVPEGATPKDGPSAGVAMATAIVSVLTGIPVKADVAMTGEITLRGRVLPIGGLKEKLLAALRGGIKKVLIPEENAKDLAEIPDNVKSGLEIIPGEPRRRGAASMRWLRMPEPIEWTEPVETARPKADARRRCRSPELRPLSSVQRAMQDGEPGLAPGFSVKKARNSGLFSRCSSVFGLVGGTLLSMVRFLPVELRSPVFLKEGKFYEQERTGVGRR